MHWIPVKRPIGIGLAVLVVATGFLTRGGMHTLAASMLSALIHVRPATILEIVALGSAAALLSGVEWWRLLHRLGYSVPFRAGFTAYLSAGLGGYVVNSVGPALGSAASLRQHGVTPGRAALLTLIANALGFCGILVWTPLGLVVLARTGVDRSLPIIGGRGPIAAALALLSLALIMLFVLRALASASTSRNRLARRLLGSVPNGDGDARPLSSRQLIALVPWSAASWVVGIGALYVALSTMSPGIAVSFGTVIGAAALAAGLGSLAFIVPEGVGVSESAVAVLLAHASGVPVTTGLAAALAVRALDPLTKLCLLGALALSGAPATRLVARVHPWSPRFDLRGTASSLVATRQAFLALPRQASFHSSALLADVLPLARALAKALGSRGGRFLDDILGSKRTAFSTLRARGVALLACGMLLLGVAGSLPRTAQAHATRDWHLRGYVRAGDDRQHAATSITFDRSIPRNGSITAL